MGSTIIPRSLEILRREIMLTRIYESVTTMSGNLRLIIRWRLKCSVNALSKPMPNARDSVVDVVLEKQRGFRDAYLISDNAVKFIAKLLILLCYK